MVVDRFLASSKKKHKGLIRAHVNVVDGDTVRSGEQLFRLLGVNAPELGTDAGHFSKKHLEKLINDKPIFLYDTGASSFGRAVVKCYDLTGNCLNYGMIASGHAKLDTRFCKLSDLSSISLR